MMKNSPSSIVLLLLLLVIISLYHAPSVSAGKKVSSNRRREITSNEVLPSNARNSSTVPCQVPRYQPYFWVKDVSATEIILGVTDPNKSRTVTGYTIYYWGHRFGAESTVESGNRDYGQRNIGKEGPFVISGLKPGFVYCADITAVNTCGHGPFCIACFENIATLQK